MPSEVTGTVATIQSGITLSIKDGDEHPIDNNNANMNKPVTMANKGDTEKDIKKAPKSTLAQGKGSSEVIAKKEVNTTLSIAMELIKSFECKNGIHTTAYKDHTQRTIGCGTKAKAWNEKITEEEALTRLRERAKVDLDVVQLDFPRHSPKQQAALTSLRFNCPSVYNWLASSGITEKKFKSCVYASDKKQPGLVTRRNAEWLVYSSNTF